LGKTFTFFAPTISESSAVNPEIELLLHATPKQSCLRAGTSALGQEAFKVMKTGNRMRY